MAEARKLTKALERIRGLRDDRRGAAALEFAFIAPILLALYFVTMELSQGIEANRKVGRIGSMVADLVTQEQGSIDESELEAIMEIGESIMQPYNRSNPTIVVTGIDISPGASPKATVAWSRKLVGGAFEEGLATGTEIAVPDDLLIEDTFLVRATAKLDYRPMITWTAEQKASLGLAAAFDKIEMKETYYLRPRMSAEIVCNGC